MKKVDICGTFCYTWSSWGPSTRSPTVLVASPHKNSLDGNNISSPAELRDRSYATNSDRATGASSDRSNPSSTPSSPRNTFKTKFGVDSTGQNLSEETLQNVFDELDLNDDQHIYFTDFAAAIISSRLNAGDEKLIRATFDRFDVDHSGAISVGNLRVLFGDKFGSATVLEMLKEADFKRDDQISLDEFRKFVLEGSMARLSGSSGGSGMRDSPVRRGSSEGTREEEVLVAAAREARGATYTRIRSGSGKIGVVGGDGDAEPDAPDD